MRQEMIGHAMAKRKKPTRLVVTVELTATGKRIDVLRGQDGEIIGPHDLPYNARLVAFGRIDPSDQYRYVGALVYVDSRSERPLKLP